MKSPPHGAAVRREELVGIVGWPQDTNELIVEEWRKLGIQAGMLSPTDARSLLRRHDVAVGRFDVRATLDGVQPGLRVLASLRQLGSRRLSVRDDRRRRPNALCSQFPALR